MAQISEFAFVLASRSRDLRLISRETYYILLGSTSLSLAIFSVVWKLMDRQNYTFDEMDHRSRSLSHKGHISHLLVNEGSGSDTRDSHLQSWYRKWLLPRSYNSTHSNLAKHYNRAVSAHQVRSSSHRGRYIQDTSVLSERTSSREKPPSPDDSESTRHDHHAIRDGHYESGSSRARSATRNFED